MATTVEFYDAPLCDGDFMHCYRRKGEVFRKGSLCRCGGAVLDRQVRAVHEHADGPAYVSNWLLAGGWFALLEEVG